MNALATIACLLTAGNDIRSQSADVDDYGTGLVPCGTYPDARQKDSSAEVVAFIDWLVGYFFREQMPRRTAITTFSDHRTSTRRWGDSMRSVVTSPRPSSPRGGHLAVRRRLRGRRTFRRSDPLRLWIQALPVYIEDGRPQSLDGEEFVHWLGGYLSGVNAISLRTNDVLGTSKLDQAVYWLDTYCSSHPVAPFSQAVNALVYSGPSTALWSTQDTATDEHLLVIRLSSGTAYVKDASASLRYPRRNESRDSSDRCCSIGSKALPEWRITH